VFSALLLPAALAMVELARVPLALAVRTQEAWHIKFFAAAGVIAAIVVTSFSLSQIAWKTFDIRIAEATRANDRLAAVKKERDDFQNKVDQLGRDIDQKINARNSINERVAALEAQITKVSSSSGNSCRRAACCAV
jgi:Skp family chaperone for outer membrane proteins